MAAVVALETLREAARSSRPILLDKVGEPSPACTEGNLSGSTEKGVVSTVGGAGGICLLRRPAPSGTKVSRLCTKGVAAVKPCGGVAPPTGSPAADETSAEGENLWPCTNQEGRQDEQGPDVLLQ